MLLAIRIEVDSLAATRDNLPPLVEALQACGAGASFFINMGPDRAGKAVSKLFDIGSSKAQIKLNRSLARAHGWARLYGSLLPSPEIGKQAGDALRALQEAGFELGLLSWDRVQWAQQIAQADEAWVERHLHCASQAFEKLFGQPAKGLALPGWQANRAAFRLAQRMGFDYMSASRGSLPHRAVLDGEPVSLTQLPTTLPTLAELISRPGEEGSAVDALLARSERLPLTGQVFSLHLQRDAGKRLPLLRQLFAGWQAQGYELASLQRLHSVLKRDALPWHRVQAAPLAPFCGQRMQQGLVFPD